MNSTLGRRALPCHHGHANLPKTAGTYPKRCKVCKTTHFLTVEPSPHLAAKLGRTVLVAHWTTLTKAAS